MHYKVVGTANHVDIFCPLYVRNSVLLLREETPLASFCTRRPGVSGMPVWRLNLFYSKDATCQADTQ